MPSIADYDRMLQAAAAVGPVTAAIAAAHETQVLLAACEASERGIIEPVLVGDAQEIVRLADERGLDLGGMRIVDCPDPEDAAAQTMRLVAQDEVRVAVKGQMQTSKFLRAALRRQAGLRTERLVTHVGVFEIPGLERLLFITDGGVVLYPTKEQKMEIVSNAITVAKAMGIEKPRVAMLAADDSVRAEQPVTEEIAEIAGLEERWANEGAYVDGPFLLDTAVSPQTAQRAGRSGPVAGRAEVLVGPDVESINIMAKGITYFAGGRMAGLVVGTKAPLVVGSRADPPHTRLVCMAAGALFAAWLDSLVRQSATKKLTSKRR